MTDTEMVYRLSAWCDTLRRAIETYLAEQEASNQKLKLALTSWQTSSSELIEKGESQ
jgi:hypothetical protein